MLVYCVLLGSVLLVDAGIPDRPKAEPAGYPDLGYNPDPALGYTTEPPSYSAEPPSYSTNPPSYTTESPSYTTDQHSHDQYNPLKPDYRPTARPAPRPLPYPPKYDEEADLKQPEVEVKWSNTDVDNRRSPIVPSRNPGLGYVPEEIQEFRKQFKELKEKYSGYNLFDPADIMPSLPKYQEENSGRGGRVFGFDDNVFKNLLSNLGILYWPIPQFSDPSSSLFISDQTQANVGGSINMNGILPAIENVINPGGQKTDPQMAGVEVCGNGDGVCENAGFCASSGAGSSIGKCPNCPSCAVCCSYEYSGQDTTNKTISFFVSPNYPQTRRESFSSSLTLEVRNDVSQVLIEFIDFEMPINPGGCSDQDYMEIIAPQHPGGVFGPGNSRLCGLNSGQHIYVSVRANELLIIRAVTSGVGFVPLAIDPDRTTGPQAAASSGDNAFRYKLKITQIISTPPMRRKSINTNIAGFGTDVAEAYLDVRVDVPEYYKRLKAPAGCRQYYFDERGTVESFNFDGISRWNNRQDYSICFRNPHKLCGMSIQAARFSIPAARSGCRSGANIVDGGLTCCTGLRQNARKKRGTPDYRDDQPAVYGGYDDHYTEDSFEKYIGIDGTSDGELTGTKYRTNQLRYFFCGNKFGRSNFVVAARKGFLRLQVFSDDVIAPMGPNGENIGFKLNYEMDTGTCG